MSGISTNGLNAVAPPLTGNEQAAFDTGLTQGQTPETVAITASQLRGYYRPAIALTFGATVNTNALLGDLFTFTATSNFTLANPTGLQSGQSLRWEITQDGTGSRLATYGNLFKFSGSSVLTTTAGAVDLLTCTYDGTVLLCTLAKAFA